MMDLIKAINIVENTLAEYWEHNETGQHYQAIDALESVLNKLNNELHAEELLMELYFKECEMEEKLI